MFADSPRGGRLDLFVDGVLEGLVLEHRLAELYRASFEKRECPRVFIPEVAGEEGPEIMPARQREVLDGLVGEEPITPGIDTRLHLRVVLQAFDESAYRVVYTEAQRMRPVRDHLIECRLDRALDRVADDIDQAIGDEPGDPGSNQRSERLLVFCREAQP